MKRSVATDGTGIPLHLVTAPANSHDSPLLEPTLTGLVDLIGTLPQYHDLHGHQEFPNLHLDRGYDSARPAPLDKLGFTRHRGHRGIPRRSRPARDGWSNERTRG